MECNDPMLTEKKKSKFSFGNKTFIPMDHLFTIPTSILQYTNIRQTESVLKK